jgi:hypothetical protein
MYRDGYVIFTDLIYSQPSPENIYYLAGTITNINLRVSFMNSAYAVLYSKHVSYYRIWLWWK